jgi:hypothetical protein
LTAQGQHGLLQYGYKQVLLDCDSWQVAYMLCSINATYEEESPYKPERKLESLLPFLLP